MAESLFEISVFRCKRFFCRAASRSSASGASGLPRLGTA